MSDKVNVFCRAMIVIAASSASVAVCVGCATKTSSRPHWSAIGAAGVVLDQHDNPVPNFRLTVDRYIPNPIAECLLPGMCGYSLGLSPSMTREKTIYTDDKGAWIYVNRNVLVTEVYIETPVRGMDAGYKRTMPSSVQGARPWHTRTNVVLRVIRIDDGVY